MRANGARVVANPVTTLAFLHGTLPAMQDAEPRRGRPAAESRIASATIAAMVVKYVLLLSNKGVSR
jgi:hypothetical protein